jgi:hypothetical protein
MMHGQKTIKSVLSVTRDWERTREWLSHAFWGMEDVKNILLNPPGTKKWAERGVCGIQLRMKENIPLNGGYEKRE